MPRYYYHVHDGRDHADSYGTELADLGAARREAARFAGALLAEESEDLWNAEHCTVRVTDDKQLTLFQLTFFATAAPATLRSFLRPDQHRLADQQEH